MKSRIAKGKRPSGLLVVVGLIFAALAIAGCGGGGSSTGSTGGSGAETTAGSGAETVSSGGGAAAAGLEAAETEVTQLLKPPPQDLGITKLPSLPPDLKMVFIKCGVPACTGYVQGAEVAAKAAGVSLKVIDAGNASASQTQAWDQAVSEKPDAVIEEGFQLSLFGKQLAAFKAAGIPVVTAGDTAGATEPDVTVDVDPPSTIEYSGKREANWIIAKSGGKGNALYVETPEIPLITVVAHGFESEMAKNCPECKVSKLKVQIEDIGKSIPGQIVSYLQQNPETEWISFGFGDLVAGVPEALQGAGINGVHIISGGGSKLNWGYIESGGQEAEIAADFPLYGWWMVDRAMRAAGGEVITKPPAPLQQFLTQGNLNFDFSKGWVAVPDYEKQFVEGWEGKGE